MHYDSQVNIHIFGGYKFRILFNSYSTFEYTEYLCNEFTSGIYLK